MHLPLSQEFGGDRPRSSHPPSECLPCAPLHTRSGLLFSAFFFWRGGAFCVFLNFFFLLEDQDRPKIHDQNVFALDFALEEATILAAKPSGTKWRSGGVTLFDL